MARIMLLTAQYTGKGHMSISQALAEQFAMMDDVELDIVDGFRFMGSHGVKTSKIYNVVTQHSPEVWEVAFKAAHKGDVVPDLMGMLVQRRLESYLRDTSPDMILTVHPMFVGSVIDVLERSRLDIPVVSLEADIVNIHSAWCDPRTLITICPTKEAYECSLGLGMPAEKLEVIGFPTRAAFCEAARAGAISSYDPTRPVRCLIMGGGGGAGEIEEYATALMRDTQAHLTVVCGSNERLREHLEDKLGIWFRDRVQIKGFVTDMESIYAACDISICRASPNSMFEAVVMGVPMIITGALPGQEKDNPRFVVEHDLGVICDSPDMLSAKIGELTADGGRRLRQIREAQLSYRNLDSAKQIAKYVRALASRTQSALI